jgi:chemotaxis signal transduction protein
MNFHGSIVAVMDLAAFLGFPAVIGPEKVIVLDPGVAALAFLVERVERIVPAEQLRQDEVVPPAEDRFVSDTIVLAEGTALLLDAVLITKGAGEALQAQGGVAGRG